MQKIVLATANPGKIREFQSILHTLPFELVNQAEFNVPDVEETGLTFVENALIKARHTSQLTGLPAIADDSGLCVDILNGAPGIYSARYAGKEATREEKMAKLLAELKDVPAEKRSARFYSVLVYLKFWNDPLPIIAEGFWEGRILLEPKGTEGFGYEPVFYVPTHNCSAAELSLAEKMNLSHRGKALNILLKLLSEKCFIGSGIHE